MIRTILFDVDGTLWDSSQAVTDAWNEVLRKKGVHEIMHAQMMQAMGHTMTEIADMLFYEQSKQVRIALMTECMNYENSYLCTHPGTFYPGVEQTLNTLKKEGYLLGIVSNCQDGYIQAMLASNKKIAPFFLDFECFGRTGKPKADSIQILMKRNQMQKKETVYVGDTAMDEQAARTAGIRFIHAAYGFGTAEHPDGVIEQMDQLPAVLKLL